MLHKPEYNLSRFNSSFTIHRDFGKKINLIYMSTYTTVLKDIA